VNGILLVATLTSLTGSYFLMRKKFYPLLKTPKKQLFPSLETSKTSNRKKIAMENPLFISLFQQGHYNLEDFTTEVLAGVLRSNQTLLDGFVNQVLGIKGEHFALETQGVYGDLTIDMVLSNQDTLCFLTLNTQAVAEEKKELLETSELVLLSEQTDNLKVYLRYCSKYYDKLPKNSLDFAQFRWADVFVFLQSYVQNPLVKASLEFLEKNNMRGITELNTEDLAAISTLNDTVNKMDECLDSVAAEFTMLFGYPSQGSPKKTSERLTLLVEFNSYRMMKDDILLGGGGWSEITACFDYEKVSGPSTNLAVWYWCDRTHSQYELLKDLFRQNKRMFSAQPGFFFEERPIGLRIIIQKPLTDFNSKSNLQAIHDWFSQTLEVFRKFADKTPQLSWNIPQ
jgi:hypothetical protein